MIAKEYRNDIISLVVTIILGISIIFLSNLIYNNGFINDKINKGIQYYKAEVTDVLKEKLQDDKYVDDVQLGYQEVNLKILEGEYKDKVFKVTNNISRLYSTKVQKGSKVIVAAQFEGEKIVDMTISSFERSYVYIALLVLFFVTIIIIGGYRGFKSIISLIFTLICVIYLMLPMMLRGISPILASIIVAIISTADTLILVSGISKKSLTTILGTIAGVLLSGILAYLFGKYANLSGINMSNADNVLYVSEVTKLKIKGIMFAGILISSLGAVMDVAMSISSSLFEIYSLNKKITIRQLFLSGMNIGRDIIGTMSHTLILAFAGSSLGTLLLIYCTNMANNRLFNLDVIGTELIQGVAGSIGIILTVPITAIIAAYLCKVKFQWKKTK